MTDKACCTLGRRGDIGAINAALRSGMKVRDVAKLYGVGKTVVGEHRAKCLRLDDPRPRKGDAEPETTPPPKAPAPPETDAAPTPEPEPVPVDVLDEVRREVSADKKADSGQGERTLPEGVVAPRARLVPRAKDAKTFVEQSLVCADMVAAGTWEGRASVRWLSALWNLSAEAVRERHRAGAVAAEADRGHIEAERQVAIGALQEQEWIALEAFEASKEVVDEAGNVSPGEPKFLAVAQKARADIARIAGCIPSGTNVQINILERPEFTDALRHATRRMLEVLVDPAPIAARLAGPVTVEAVLAAVREELAAKAGDDKAITTTGEAA